MSYVFKPSWQNEGVGAKVIRVIGNQHLKRLDPFLMLDHFRVKLPAGFPDHPHRGFETVTYMKQGTMHHEDFKGHKGSIGPGDIQWMTAGKGIVHSQIPGSFEDDSVGFQLWLNLKASDKLQQPQYQQYLAHQIPCYEKDGAEVKLICGSWNGHVGPIKYTTPAYYMDVRIPEKGQFSIDIPKQWNAIVYAYKGKLQYRGQKQKQNVQIMCCCVLEKSLNKTMKHQIKSQTGAKFVIIAGEPLNEPIVQHGPFVMNSEQQIQQTFKDYQMCQNGFENAHNWESKIKRLRQGVKMEDL